MTPKLSENAKGKMKHKHVHCPILTLRLWSMRKIFNKSEDLQDRNILSRIKKKIPLSGILKNTKITPEFLVP